jgi:aryl-alcohol dehydrogenase-like predicted oxidoreductase
MERRDFLRSAAAGVPLTAGAVFGPFAVAPAAEPSGGRPPKGPDETIRDGMRYRTLGRTGEKVSVIGLGGYHIGVPKDENEGIKLIRAAVDQGITFLDNCWAYHDGGSEVRMGKALRDGYRQKVFLMTKTEGRTKAAVARQLDESLRRLQTDHVDLLQFHEVIRLEDPDRIFAQGGGMEAMLAAKKAGKVRYIGFTGHKDPLVHLRMLEIADQHGFRFDAVQMPLNVLDAHFRSFGQQVVPVLVKQGTGVLGMKPLASGIIPQSNTATAVECLHYAMNLPASVVITGIESMAVLKQALEAARTFRPLTVAQVSALLAKTAKAAATGRYEPFKTTQGFDATARHPEWME